MTPEEILKDPAATVRETALAGKQPEAQRWVSGLVVSVNTEGYLSSD